MSRIFLLEQILMVFNPRTLALMRGLVLAAAGYAVCKMAVAITLVLIS